METHLLNVFTQLLISLLFKLIIILKHGGGRVVIRGGVFFLSYCLNLNSSY